MANTCDLADLLARNDLGKRVFAEEIVNICETRGDETRRDENNMTVNNNNNNNNYYYYNLLLSGWW